MGVRTYRYVGPAELRDLSSPGSPIDRAEALAAWWRARSEPETIATFTVPPDGLLRIAPRRSEHVVCAGTIEVLAAGELGFDPHGTRVVYASNQSTGFCPAIESWSALERALDAAGIAHPATWTASFEFRRCPECDERTIVKDDWFECAMCGADLPRDYNF